jgi:hypothetical protein
MVIFKELVHFSNTEMKQFGTTQTQNDQHQELQ